MTSISRPSRWTVIKTVSGGTFLAYLAYPQETEVVIAASATTAVTYAGYRTFDFAALFMHRRNWINPLHATLIKPLGLTEDIQARDYIKIPRDYHKREDVGRIDLPDAFTGVDTSTVTSVIKSKLGLTDCSVTYRLAGRKPHLIIRQTPRPPGKCPWSDYQVVADAMPEPSPLIGIGPKGKKVSVDLDAESPHILVSASTGGGKSVITRTMSVQMLHNGARMTVLDFKRHSHKWARGLPQVHYCRDIAEIHDELVRLGREGHRRNRIVDDHEGDGEPEVGPRHILLLEEANATMAKLKRYWATSRTKEDPKESPAIDSLREILFMGRAVKMHVLLVAQSATAAALGGPEVRECFATRILSRYTVNAWRMLVPEVHPIPRSTRHIGRAQVVLGGEATETQVLFLSDSEAREWATSGVVAPSPTLSRHAVCESPTWEDAPDASRDVTPKLALVKERLSLAEASRRGVVPLSADALRQAKRRDPEFPRGVDGRFTAEELSLWHRNRPSKTA